MILISWHLAMRQIFCCSIIQGVSFNYHQRNVRSRVSVSAFMTKSRSRLLWQCLSLVSKFEPGLGLGGRGLDYITGRNTPAPETLRAVQWFWAYVSLVKICQAVSTCQLKFQQSTTDIFIVIVPYCIHYFAFVMVQALDSST